MGEIIWEVFVLLVALFALWVGGKCIETRNYSSGILNIGLAVINLVLFFKMIGG